MTAPQLDDMNFVCLLVYMCRYVYMCVDVYLCGCEDMWMCM